MGNKERKFKAQMTKDALFDFMLHHTYSGLTGWFSIVFSIVFAVVGIVMYVTGKTTMTWMLCLIFIGVALAFSTPFQLKNDAARQIRKNPVYSQPLNYVFSDRGITVSQKGNKQSFTWNQIVKVRITKKSVSLYYDKKTAMVIPREIFDQQGLLDIIKENVSVVAMR